MKTSIWTPEEKLIWSGEKRTKYLKSRLKAQFMETNTKSANYNTPKENVLGHLISRLVEDVKIIVESPRLHEITGLTREEAEYIIGGFPIRYNKSNQITESLDDASIASERMKILMDISQGIYSIQELRKTHRKFEANLWRLYRDNHIELRGDEAKKIEGLVEDYIKNDDVVRNAKKLKKNDFSLKELRKRIHKLGECKSDSSLANEFEVLVNDYLKKEEPLLKDESTVRLWRIAQEGKHKVAECRGELRESHGKDIIETLKQCENLEIHLSAGGKRVLASHGKPD